MVCALLNKRTRAFTLIELLVVIAIIALLLSILMPSLNKVKRQAQSAVCRSNIRQLNVGLATYVIDNDDKAFYYPPDGSTLMSSAWYRIIHEYIGDHDNFISGQFNEDQFDVLYCPTAKKVSPEFLPWAYGNGNARGKAYNAWKTYSSAEGSYGFNWWLFTGPHAKQIVYDAGLDDFVPNFYDKTMNAPSRLVTFADSAWNDFMLLSTEADARADYNVSHNINTLDPMAGTTFTEPYSGLARLCMDRHNKAINIGFMDGSVETVKLQDLFMQKYSKGTVRYKSFSPWELPWKFK